MTTFIMLFFLGILSGACLLIVMHIMKIKSGPSFEYDEDDNPMKIEEDI